MIPLIVIALAVGAALGWKARGSRCGILCDPAEARTVLAHRHADGYEEGVRDGTRVERGTLDDPHVLRRVRSVLRRPRVTVDGPRPEETAGAAA